MMKRLNGFETYSESSGKAVQYWSNNGSIEHNKKFKNKSKHICMNRILTKILRQFNGERQAGTIGNPEGEK